MSTETQQHTIDALTAAAQVVTDMPPNEWAGWIAYFCESINALEPEANVHLWLADDVEAMQERLETGEL